MTNTGMYFAELDTFNRIVEGLYDKRKSSVERLSDFLENLMELVPYERGSVFFFYQDRGGLYKKHSSIDINWNGDCIKQYDDYCCQIDDTLKFLDVRYPVAFKSSSFFNQSKRARTEFWLNYLLPNNCIYSIEGNFKCSHLSNLKGGFALFRGEGNQDFSDRDLKIIRFFQPHINATLQGDSRENEDVPLSDVLNESRFWGLCLYDHAFRPIYSNLKYRDLGKLTEFKIHERVIELCADLKREGESEIIQDYQWDGNPYFLEIRVIANDEKQRPEIYSCQIVDQIGIVQANMDKGKINYNLSDREREIIWLLLKGSSNEDIGNQLFLSVPTVKKYLATIYSKMGINSQRHLAEKLNLI